MSQAATSTPHGGGGGGGSSPGLEHQGHVEEVTACRVGGGKFHRGGVDESPVSLTWPRAMQKLGMTLNSSLTRVSLHCLRCSWGHPWLLTHCCWAGIWQCRGLLSVEDKCRVTHPRLGCDVVRCLQTCRDLRLLISFASEQGVHVSVEWRLQAIGFCKAKFTSNPDQTLNVLLLSDLQSGWPFTILTGELCWHSC